MTILNILNETMEHFDLSNQPKQEQKNEAQEKTESETKDRFAGFAKYYVGGRQVVDLTSIDEEYEPIGFNFDDPERRAIYGDKAGSTKF